MRKSSFRIPDHDDDLQDRLGRLVAAFFIAVPPVLAATDIHVAVDNCPGPGSGTSNDPFCVIQSAVDRAVDGDVFLVGPGTYFEPIDLLGKSITLRSAVGAAATTLDGPAVGSRIRVVGGETIDTLIEGFTNSQFSGNAVDGTGTVYGSAISACGRTGVLTVENSVFTANGRATYPTTFSSMTRCPNRGRGSSTCTAWSIATVSSAVSVRTV